MGVKSLCRPDGVAGECYRNEMSVFGEQTIYEFDDAKQVKSSSNGQVRINMFNSST